MAGTSLNFIVYQAANVIIFVGSLWASLSRKAPTGMFGNAVLGLLCMAALGNMVEIDSCHSWAEVWLDVAAALCVVWAFLHLEVRPRLAAKKTCPPPVKPYLTPGPRLGGKKERKA